MYSLVGKAVTLLHYIAFPQLIRQAFVDAFPSQSGRYPVAVICIDVLPADIDVNLEPNKTTVLFHNMVRFWVTGKGSLFEVPS